MLIGRNTLIHRERSKNVKKREYIERAELITINGVIEESADHISEVINRVNKLYSNVVNALANHELHKFRKTDKNVATLNNEIHDLKDGFFYFIQFNLFNHLSFWLCNSFQEVWLVFYL